MPWSVAAEDILTIERRPIDAGPFEQVPDPQRDDRGGQELGDRGVGTLVVADLSRGREVGRYRQERLDVARGQRRLAGVALGEWHDVDPAVELGRGHLEGRGERRGCAASFYLQNHAGCHQGSGF